MLKAETRLSGTSARLQCSFRMASGVKAGAGVAHGPQQHFKEARLSLGYQEFGVFLPDARRLMNLGGDEAVFQIIKKLLEQAREKLQGLNGNVKGLKSSPYGLELVSLTQEGDGVAALVKAHPGGYVPLSAACRAAEDLRQWCV